MHTKLKTIRVAQATNLALDWLIAKIMRVQVTIVPFDNTFKLVTHAVNPGDSNLYCPTISPNQAYDVVMRYQVSTWKDDSSSDWLSSPFGVDSTDRDYDCGATPLLAQMRAVATMVFGLQPEVPEVLTRPDQTTESALIAQRVANDK